ncbi:hypothetical protein HU200_060586 [Digitaria exilis]|uniref:ARM repeat superfamily protein n=1 Tax=Digitaria exilis TaxID=1010633 RepID=A0A835AAG9_9POAL|nr:hypothetical protein HU200_060586 [Digitaria exilis]CAB3491398.1 unnamed protein product [Digitaria exilis]
MGFHGCPFCTQISFFILAALLVGNLQIPAAVTQVVLSTLRLRRLCGAHAHHDYYLQPQVYNQNLVPSITVFYTLAFCEGAFYIMACILGVFSFFPCRSLLLRSGFTGQWGSKAVDLYYRRVYTTRMETGVLAAGSMMTLDTFAMESLKSSSQEVRLIGVRVLDSLLQESDSSKMLISRITMSSEAMSALISMLGGTEVQDEGGMRLFAARVTANIAGHLRIAEAPAGMVKSVSSLLDAEKLSLTSTRNGENNAGNHHTYGTSAKERNRGLSWVCHCWQRTKDKWSVPDEPPLTQQDSFTVMGMVILRRLAHDPDNCVEIVKATTLISKIIGLITYTTDNHNSVILCSSLHLVRRLVSTGGKIGVTIRQELSDSPFLIDNLVGICEDSRSSPEVLMLAMDIIAKLALEENARQEVGSKQVIICKLVHSFLGQDEANDQESLRMAAGEALVNLTIESPANCSAILEVLGCHLIKDLKDMLCEAEYRIYMCTAASLLQNLCAHSRDKLTSLPGAGEHLRSTLPAVMENIVSTEGKQLETWIGLASQICSISECFIFDLESQSNNVGARVVRKLMGTLSSNMKPRCQYPRMRRVIVEMVISFVTSYPGYQTMLRDEGVMETLSKVAMTPSKVEKYRVFSGVDGVVLECGLPLRDLVDRAKGLIGHATPYPGS